MTPSYSWPSNSAAGRKHSWHHQFMLILHNHI